MEKAAPVWTSSDTAHDFGSTHELAAPKRTFNRRARGRVISLACGQAYTWAVMGVPTPVHSRPLGNFMRLCFNLNGCRRVGFARQPQGGWRNTKLLACAAVLVH